MSGLPFLNHRKLASTIIMRVKPEGSLTPEKEEGRQAPELELIAEDLIRAVHSKDASAVADVLDALLHWNASEEESMNEEAE